MSAPFFKVGDKVRCIKASTCGFAGEVGQIYTVRSERSSPSGLGLEGEGVGGIDERRFELVKPDQPLAQSQDKEDKMSVARDKNGKEIRVGDRVRRVSSENVGVKPGTEFTVVRIAVGGWPVGDRDSDNRAGKGLGHHPGSIELISSTAKEESELSSAQCSCINNNMNPPETELERLVRKANEGREAERTLYKNFSKQYEVRSDNSMQMWNGFDKIVIVNTEFRVKPRPAFTPFTVGNGWTVELKGDRLTIGCREYDAKIIRREFDQMCRKDFVNSYSGSSLKLAASRKGISSEGQSITWDEAERILKALEAADV